MKKWLHATIIGRLNIFKHYILEYINEKVSSCHSNRRIKYPYKFYFRKYYFRSFCIPRSKKD